MIVTFTSIYTLIVILISSVVVTYYLRQIWQSPRNTGEIFGHWVTSLLYIIFMEFLYLFVDQGWLPQDRAAHLTNSLLILILTQYIHITLAIHYERDLSANKVGSWRLYRFIGMSTTSTSILLIIIGFILNINPIYYQFTDYVLFGSTLAKNVDLYYIGIAFLLSAAIPVILWPWFTNGKMHRDRFFLALGGGSQALGKAMQFFRSAIECNIAILDSMIQVMFLLSVVFIYIGVSHKRTLFYLESTEKLDVGCEG